MVTYSVPVLRGKCSSNRTVFCIIYLLLLLSITSDAFLLDWLWNSSEGNMIKPKIGDLPAVKIPFEVSTEDEKFIQEAKKYTSLKLSDLDSCQHHIVLKIRNSCADITEEELAKMSVNLLNCQAAVEGRQQFLCTNKMTLRECTRDMDPDMWNTYHLMNNRARAVCYAARHQQFRALSEMTVNKLMDTAHSQLEAMNTLKEGQDKLESITSNTMESVSHGHQTLMDQQEKLRVTQRNIQDFVALNLRELTREKALIAAGHRELAKMTEDVKKKLDEASSDLNNQVNERRENHLQLLEDLDSIQKQAGLIWEQIELSTAEILTQHSAAAAQYEATLNKLGQINITVSYLLNLTDNMRHELDERLGWITKLMGGTGEQVDRLYRCVLHILYLVIGMITVSFVHAPTFTRAMLVLVVPLNLAITYHHGENAALDFPSLTILIITVSAVNWILHILLDYWNPKKPMQMYYLQGTPQSQPMRNGSVTNTSPLKQIHNKMVTLEVLREFIRNKIMRLQSFISNWRSGSKSFTNEDNSEIQFPTRETHMDSAEESSDTDDVDNMSQGIAFSTYGNSDFLRALSSTHTPRQRSSTPHLYTSPSTPSRTSSRSGTPSRTNLSRSACLAICRSGQPCRNNASMGSSMCRMHSLSSPVKS